MKLSVILGTRPELIKLALIARRLRESDHDVDIVYTGQHYDRNMSGTFVEELDWAQPDIMLECNSGSHAEQTGSILVAVEKYLRGANPDISVILGDTNTTLAGSLAASKLGIPIAHIEAGCRCFDLKMPEEINRCMVDAISTLYFPPTEECAQNLFREGISPDKVTIVGYTQGEVCGKYLASGTIASKALERIGVRRKEYALITVHRQENADVRGNLHSIIEALPEITIPVVFPVHPRTKKRLEKYGLFSRLTEHPNVRLMDPLGYSDFLLFLSNASIVMTDSGGVQEEAAMLHIPCVTLREKTELIETVEAGVNVLVGADRKKIVSEVNRILGDDSVYQRMSDVEVYPEMCSSDIVLRKLEEWYDTVSRCPE